jgi:hypothetical protein
MPAIDASSSFGFGHTNLLFRTIKRCAMKQQGRLSVYLSVKNTVGNTNAPTPFRDRPFSRCLLPHVLGIFAYGCAAVPARVGTLALPSGRTVNLGFSPGLPS